MLTVSRVARSDRHRLLLLLLLALRSVHVAVVGLYLIRFVVLLRELAVKYLDALRHV